MTMQIGWYSLKEDNIFRNTYECAAWYEDILVKSGKYPIFVHDFRILNHDNPDINNMVDGHIGAAYVHMNGVIVSDEFGARFFGVPVGDYDNRKNAGKPSTHSMVTYMYSVAGSIINDLNSPFELLPEYEARAIHGELDGKPYTTHAIYKKTSIGMEVEV